MRYNPGGDRALNRRQAVRLRELSDYLHGSGRLFMFELLVPPTADQLQRSGNDKSAYDVQLRPMLAVQAIHELQDLGVEPDVWKIEGLQRKEDCERVVAAARRAGRDNVGCIVLGRHEDEQTVRTVAPDRCGRSWVYRLRGRPHNLLGPAGRLPRKKITRDTAVARIAASYRGWVDLFEKEKRQSPEATAVLAESRQ